MRDKVLKLVAADAETVVRTESALDELVNDALSALINLGYRNQAAEEALSR